MPTVAICGEKYSSNLGDGVIADCLEWLIGHERPDVAVRTVDMSRKTAFSAEAEVTVEGAGRPRSRARDLIPGFVRRSIREAQWERGPGPRLHRHAAEILRGCDALVIGGGQLLMDNNLRFPMKIRSVTSAARAVGVPKMACFGVGVGGKWSGRGRQILASALREPTLTALVVRDETSGRTIAREFPTLGPLTSVAGDPALFSGEAYGCGRNPSADGPVGLGVLGLRLLSATAGQPGVSDPRAASEAFWLGVIDGLHRAGRRAELFTNGDELDQAFAEHLAKANRDRGGPEVALAPRPTDPGALVRRISGYSGLIAYRLHSNIIGYSLGIPGALMTWDSKVRHFAEMTGRGELAFPGLGVDAEAVVGAALGAIERGLDRAVWEATRERVRASLRGTLDGLLGAGGQRA
jgi:polysaccharide pyruvyl transferase WcaK-like protein